LERITCPQDLEIPWRRVDIIEDKDLTLFTSKETIALGLGVCSQYGIIGFSDHALP
jgi:hypothetical protein